MSRDQNPRYWSLIKAFGDRTGVPMLLNTSFNNNEEPIVDSVEDAIVCFLTTDLDYLVVGDYLIRKKGELRVSVGDLIPVLPRYVWLSASTLPGNPNGARRYQLRTTFDQRKDFEIDRDTFRLLESIDGKTTLNCLAERVLEGASERRAELTTSILELWSRRLIRIKPRAA